MDQLSIMTTLVSLAPLFYNSKFKFETAGHLVDRMKLALNNYLFFNMYGHAKLV